MVILVSRCIVYLKPIAFLAILSLSLVSFSLFAQDFPVNLHIKDTSELRKIWRLTMSDIDQTKKVNQDTINSILSYSLQLRDTSAFFYFCKDIDRCYYDLGLNEKAILFLKESQKIVGTDNSRFGDLNNGLGRHYSALDYHIEALDYYFKSVKWYEKFQKHNTTIPLGNVADIYFENENYEKSLEYNLLALNYSLKLTDLNDKRYNLIFDYFRIGAIYHKLQNNSKAEEYFTKSLEVAREHKKDFMMLLALTKAINFYDNIGKNEVCQKLIAEGDVLLKDSKLSEHGLARYFLLKKNQHYLNSGQLHKAIHPKDIQFEDPALKSEILTYSGDYYTINNDIENAVKFYKKLIEENQKTERESRMNTFSNLEDKYTNKELKKKNQELLSDIEQRKRTILIIFAILALISSLLILQLINNRRHKKLNTLLQNKAQELKKSNEELERFTYIASHDLKTPLRNIVNFTNLLERQLKSHENDTVHEYLSFIKKGGIRLNNLIESTLEYSRLSHTAKENQAEEIDLNLLLSDLEQSMSSSIEERNATITKQNHLPTIKAHQASIIILFQNFIENGIKYNKSETPTIEIYTKKSPNSFSIFIRDNGIGISEEYHNKIFTMFSRLHNQKDYEGSGLGLSICKKIVEQLNGEIHIQSKAGEGTVFEIRLPDNLIVTDGVAA